MLLRLTAARVSVLGTNTLPFRGEAAEGRCCICRKRLLHRQQSRASSTTIVRKMSAKIHSTSAAFKDVAIFDAATGALLEPPKEDPNYFELFQLQESFEIDTRDLQQRFRSLQAQLHPDRYGQQSEDQQELSERWSSITNRAYSKLVKPLERAHYMLELKKCPLVDGEMANNLAFLADIMETNEEVMEATSLEDLSGISKANLIVLASYTQQVSSAFDNNDLQRARQLVSEMMYYSSIQDKIKDREDKMMSTVI